MVEYVAAIDQGTTSTRFIVFDRAGTNVGSHQLEHRQIQPKAGWVEHDPVEIWQRTVEVISTTLRQLGLDARDLAAVGMTNQRETTIVWDRNTGQPLCNAIVWQDTRTASMVQSLSGRQRDVIQGKTGLVPSTYFSASKLQWILQNIDTTDAAVFGTVDSWLLWNLTGGAHLTDITNASRTMLFDITSLDWDEELLDMFDVPRAMLPEVRPSSDSSVYGMTRSDGPFGGSVPITGVLGDQHAALLGQTCTQPSEAKNTYGTGNFLMLNTGSTPVRSHHGLLTTVAFRFDDQPVTYALEGAVAVTGSAVQWLRDQLGVIASAQEIEALAASVPDNGGMYFVPAFSGLFAPYWRPDARGAIVGMSRYNTKAHLARATLEAICFQTRDVIDAMAADAGMTFTELRVDGGVTSNDLCMQIQADVLGIPVRRPTMIETTALGAAYAAGLAVGFWSDVNDVRMNWREDRKWSPRWSDEQRASNHVQWKKAVDRTLNWIE